MKRPEIFTLLCELSEDTVASEAALVSGLLEAAAYIEEHGLPNDYFSRRLLTGPLGLEGSWCVLVNGSAVGHLPPGSSTWRPLVVGA